MVVPFTDDNGLRNYRPDAGPARAQRRRWPWLIVLAFLLGLVCGRELHAADCLSLHVRTRFLLAPGDIAVQTRIAPHADHRAYDVAWDSDTGSAGRSGPFSLEGDHARTLFDLLLHDQPVGHYVFVAQVYGVGGHVLGSAREVIQSPDRP